MNYIRLGEYYIPTLIAITAEEHTKGLMFIKSNAPVMTFLYDRAEVNKFWMENTYVPLDIIFCLGGTVRSIEYGKPLSRDFIGPDFPTDTVIEMPRGSAKLFSIRNGIKIDIECDEVSTCKKLANRFTESAKSS